MLPVCSERMIEAGMRAGAKSRQLKRLRRFASIALALFAVFLLTTQFEHHDIACHLKTPQHCNACAASQLGSDPHSVASFNRVVLSDAGRAVLELAVLSGTILPAQSSGRSPPLSA